MSAVATARCWRCSVTSGPARNGSSTETGLPVAWGATCKAGAAAAAPAPQGRGGGRGLEEVVELAQLLHRREELAQVQEEGGEHTDRHLAVEHPERADEEHEQDQTNHVDSTANRPIQATT